MTQPGLVDSHIHLTDYEPGTNVGAIIRQAEAAGVTRLVCNGTSEDDWPKVLELASAHPSVIPCLGLHPWFVTRRSPDWLSTLEDLVRSHPCCGIGEIGLDRNIKPFDRTAQEEAFRAQLDLARRYERPAAIHCVRSWGWLMDVLRDEPLPERMLVHAYGGSVDLIEPLAGMGAYYSFSGKVLEPNYARARKALQAVPPDRLLLETDAPNLLPPEEYRIERVINADGSESNHPANLVAILSGVAELLGEPTENLRQRLWENACTFLGKMANG